MATLIRRRGRSESDILPPIAFALPPAPLDLIGSLLGLAPFQAVVVPATVEQPRPFVPAFEVRETPEAFVFRADVPGLRIEDLDITVRGNQLVVSGKREPEQRKEGDRYYLYERGYGRFTRSFTLPEGLDTEKIRAELHDGVLQLTIAKKPEQQPKEVDIEHGKSQPQQPQVKRT